MTRHPRLTAAAEALAFVVLALAAFRLGTAVADVVERRILGTP